MFHIYMNNQRITENPVSYNHIITNLFKHARLEIRKLSELPYGLSYKYYQYTFVRAI